MVLRYCDVFCDLQVVALVVNVLLDLFLLLELAADGKEPERQLLLEVVDFDVLK